MPNWCNNYATVYGSKDEIKKIADILDANPNGYLFESLVGIDPTVSREEYDEGKWYDSNCEYWGCKWDVSIRSACIDVNDEEITLSFETPWSPPLNFFQEMAKKYNVVINVLYDEPGNDFAGEADIDREGNIDNREYEYLEGLYHRGDDIFWDEVRSQLDYMIEEDDEPITHERVAKWLHFMTDADLYDLVQEYEDKLVK